MPEETPEHDLSKSDKIHITVDGRQVEATAGATLITVTRRMGLNIPTLCHVDSVKPAGICRLCVVEDVTRGRPKYVTACSYIVSDGMVFHTRSETIKRLRAMILELLLSRCPSSDVIRTLAAEYGVLVPRFEQITSATNDKCILCGLCTRVCEEHATAAISIQGRGQTRTISAPVDDVAQDCVGCGACESLCPTGQIQAKRGAASVEVFGKETRFCVASVNPVPCRGCGVCEEACPFRIPRVQIRRGGLSKAAIDSAACRGCGVCVAACPTGAITQPIPESKNRLPNPTLQVIACSRTGLGLASAPRLPAGVELLELPCTGGVSIEMIFSALLRGAAGVLVLGRAESTCRLNGSESAARETVARIAGLLSLFGFGENRVVFVESPSGTLGPLDAVTTFLSKLSPAPALPDHLMETPVLSLESLANVLSSLRDLSDPPDRALATERWLEANGLPPIGSHDAVLLAGDIPILDALIGHRILPASLIDVLRDALSSLHRRGISAGVALSEKEIPPRVRKENVFTLESLNDMMREDGEQEGVFAPTDSSPGGFAAITPLEREKLENNLLTAAQRGAACLRVRSLNELVQYLLLQRTGAWRKTHILPVLPVHIAAQRKAAS